MGRLRWAQEAAHGDSGTPSTKERGLDRRPCKAGREAGHSMGWWGQRVRTSYWVCSDEIFTLCRRKAWS